MENTLTNALDFLLELGKKYKKPIENRQFWGQILVDYANKLNKPCVSSSCSDEGCLNIGLYDDCGRFMGWYCKDCGKFEKDS